MKKKAVLLAATVVLAIVFTFGVVGTALAQTNTFSITMGVGVKKVQRSYYCNGIGNQYAMCVMSGLPDHYKYQFYLSPSANITSQGYSLWFVWTNPPAVVWNRGLNGYAGTWFLTVMRDSTAAAHSWTGTISNSASVVGSAVGRWHRSQGCPRIGVLPICLQPRLHGVALLNATDETSHRR